MSSAHCAFERYSYSLGQGVVRMSVALPVALHLRCGQHAPTDCAAVTASVTGLHLCSDSLVPFVEI